MCTGQRMHLLARLGPQAAVHSFTHPLIGSSEGTWHSLSCHFTKNPGLKWTEAEIKVGVSITRGGKQSCNSINLPSPPPKAASLVPDD